MTKILGVPVVTIDSLGHHNTSFNRKYFVGMDGLEKSTFRLVTGDSNNNSYYQTAAVMYGTNER